MDGRCDRCCAHSHVQWCDQDGKPRLELCWHHSRQHGPALLAAGLRARTLIDPASDHRPGGSIDPIDQMT